MSEIAERLNRLWHALVLRHVQGDLTWFRSGTVKTTCECGKVWRLRRAVKADEAWPPR